MAPTMEPYRGGPGGIIPTPDRLGPGGGRGGAPVFSPWPNLTWSFADAAKARADRSPFTPSRAAELAYERQLRSVAGQVANIVQTAGRPEDAEELLRKYAELLDPWARQSAANMVLGVRRKNDQAWRNMAQRMGLDMRRFLSGDPLGQAVAERIDENARLIKTIVTGAADKVADLAREGMVTGVRADDMAGEIARVGQVSLSRARVIAHTEVSKASSALTRARAQSVGSEGYIWRTARDGDTRPSHRAMEGKFVPWGKPVLLDNMTGHAGEFPWCRCYPEPVIPMEDTRKTYAPALPTRSDERARGEAVPLSAWERSPGGEVIRHAPGELLPNADRAWVPEGKMANYVLNPDHPRGGHKAFVLREAVGMGREHADILGKRLLEGARDLPAIRHTNNEYGEAFKVFTPVTGPNGKTVDVSATWIYDRDKITGKLSTVPRLTTAFVRKGSYAQ